MYQVDRAASDNHCIPPVGMAFPACPRSPAQRRQLLGSRDSPFNTICFDRGGSCKFLSCKPLAGLIAALTLGEGRVVVKANQECCIQIKYADKDNSDRRKQRDNYICLLLLLHCPIKG